MTTVLSNGVRGNNSPHHYNGQGPDAVLVLPLPADHAPPPVDDGRGLPPLVDAAAPAANAVPLARFEDGVEDLLHITNAATPRAPKKVRNTAPNKVIEKLQKDSQLEEALNAYSEKLDEEEAFIRTHLLPAGCCFSLSWKKPPQLTPTEILHKYESLTKERIEASNNVDKAKDKIKLSIATLRGESAKKIGNEYYNNQKKVLAELDSQKDEIQDLKNRPSFLIKLASLSVKAYKASLTNEESFLSNPKLGESESLKRSLLRTISFGKAPPTHETLRNEFIALQNLRLQAQFQAEEFLSAAKTAVNKIDDEDRKKAAQREMSTISQDFEDLATTADDIRDLIPQELVKIADRSFINNIELTEQNAHLARDLAKRAAAAQKLERTLSQGLANLKKQNSSALTSSRELTKTAAEQLIDLPNIVSRHKQRTTLLSASTIVKAAGYAAAGASTVSTVANALGIDPTYTVPAYAHSIHSGVLSTLSAVSSGTASVLGAVGSGAASVLTVTGTKSVLTATGTIISHTASGVYQGIQFAAGDNPISTGLYDLATSTIKAVGLNPGQRTMQAGLALAPLATKVLITNAIANKVKAKGFENTSSAIQAVGHTAAILPILKSGAESFGVTNFTNKALEKGAALLERVTALLPENETIDRITTTLGTDLPNKIRSMTSGISNAIPETASQTMSAGVSFVTDNASQIAGSAATVLLAHQIANKAEAAGYKKSAQTIKNFGYSAAAFPLFSKASEEAGLAGAKIQEAVLSKAASFGKTVSDTVNNVSSTGSSFKESVNSGIGSIVESAASLIPSADTIVGQALRAPINHPYITAGVVATVAAGITLHKVAPKAMPSAVEWIKDHKTAIGYTALGIGSVALGVFGVAAFAGYAGTKIGISLGWVK